MKPYKVRNGMMVCACCWPGNIFCLTDIKCSEGIEVEYCGEVIKAFPIDITIEEMQLFIDSYFTKLERLEKLNNV
jgi:hypothetical protein